MKRKLLIWVKKRFYSFLDVLALCMFFGGYVLLMTGHILLPEDFFGVNFYAYGKEHFIFPIIGMSIILLSFKLINVNKNDPKAN